MGDVVYYNLGNHNEVGQVGGVLVHNLNQHGKHPGELKNNKLNHLKKRILDEKMARSAISDFRINNLCHVHRIFVKLH